MEEIQQIVQKVVRRCATRGVSVSEVLAAFVATTTIGKNSRDGQPQYSLDQPLTEEGLNDLIHRIVDRLLEVDSPSLETIKMQVAFDSSYITEDEALTNIYQRRNLRLREMQRIIVNMRPKDSTDFDALTALHRQIFAFLLGHANEASQMGRGIEREVAAALESVFPRISLKAFINLGAEEKIAQLDELANIVLGIRVFNQHIGLGGASLPNPDKESATLLQKLGKTLSEELEKTQETCVELQQVIVHSHLRQPQGVTANILCRWKDELTNRRQFLSYLQSLQEDMAVSHRNVASLRKTITSEMKDLQELVGNRASVPKEHVYPKFYEIATQWTALYHVYRVILGRMRTTAVLQAFCGSYTPSLRGGGELQSSSDLTTALEEDALAAEAAVGVTEISYPIDGALNDSVKKIEFVQSKGEEIDDNKHVLKTGHVEAQCSAQNSTMAQTSISALAERPVKLSIESTPEFMQLPLEYQGFCPWTIVKRHGLLLPGKPHLGVIRYKNRFYVFVHQVAMCSFIKDPEVFVKGTLDHAALSPELINLLRLQESFPETCITRMLQNGKHSKPHASIVGLNATEKLEASTETPLHFTDGKIDPVYHWNEWVLRRRALQVANIRNCETKSQQTDSSHYRRENNTQVYLPRTKHTQTKKSSGSKPSQTVQYFAGLMGTSKISHKDGNRDNGRPAMVNFKFEF